MSLPKIELPSYVITLPVVNEKVTLRPFTIGEENAFITALSSNNKANISNSFIQLIQRCITGGSDITKYPISVFFYLVLMLRCKSKGEVIEGTKKCENEDCKQVFPTEIHLEKSLKWKNVGVNSKMVKLSDKMHVEMVPTSTSFLTEVETLDENSLDAVLWTLANSVSKVVFNGEIFKDFTPVELKNEVIVNLTQSQTEQMIKTLDEFATLYVDVKMVCPHCGHVIERQITDIFDFFM